MIRFIKYTTLAIFALAIAAVLASYLLNTYFNPNQFKTDITQKILARTGYTVTCNGDLAWTLFPSIGIRAHNIALHNPPGFAEDHLGEIDKLDIGIKLLALLEGKVKIHSIHMLGVKLALVTNKTGTVNWPLAKPVAAKSSPPPKMHTAVSLPVNQATNISPAHEHTKSETTTSSFLTDIPIISIENATISWENAQKNQYYRMENIYAEINQPQTQLMLPMTLEGNLSVHKEAKPIHLTFTTTLAINPAAKIYTANAFTLSTYHRRKNVTIPSQLNGTMQLNLANQTLQLHILTGNIATLPFTANIDITHLQHKPLCNGAIHINAFHVKEWLDRIGNSIPTLNTANDLRADMTFSTNTGDILVKANIDLQQAQLNKLPLSKLNLQTSYQAKVINISSLTAELLGGTVSAHGTIDLRTKTPQIMAHMALHNINMSSVHFPYQLHSKIPPTAITVTGHLKKPTIVVS